MKGALLVARFAALDAAIAEDEAKAWRHGATEGPAYATLTVHKVKVE